MSSQLGRISVIVAVVLAASTDVCNADESAAVGSTSDDHDHAGHLHFTHPLVGESPSPDTKIRFDSIYRRVHDSEEKAREYTVRLEGEYAFHPTFSIEIDVPFVFLDASGESPDSNLDDVEIGLKLANFVFEEYGVLLGYGIEFGLPTGDDGKDIGSNNSFEIEPFFDVGYRCGDLEVVGFASFGMPTNQGDGEEVENEFGYQVSTLYHLTPRVAGHLELDGETELNGDGEGETVVNITPAVSVAPLESRDLRVAAGVSFPVTGGEEVEIQTIFSLFYHF